jgi:hypothetical protein
MDHNQALQLPVSVVGDVDINRLIREMEAIDEFLHQAAIRQPGTALQLPKTSKLFDEVVAGNDLNMLQQHDRQRLSQFFVDIKMRAPRLHVSFSADPSPLFMQRFMSYIRSNIHSQALVRVGLQPNIGAGCVLRSTNHVFDMSLREDFKTKRGMLMRYIQQLHDQPTQQPTEGAVQ